jgi:hypothetical protein
MTVVTKLTDFRRSADVGVYVGPVAPEIALPARNHLYVTCVEAFEIGPPTRTLPTRASPEIVAAEAIGLDTNTAIELLVALGSAFLDAVTLTEIREAESAAVSTY